METEAVAAITASSAVSEDRIIAERKEKILKFLKQKYSWMVYIFLALVIYLSVKIRMLPTAINSATGKPGLWDITRDTWTLGPDLDPFLFLRWAKYIVEHGSLFTIDTLRNFPLGFNTKVELLLHPYMMAWFHKYIAPFFGSTSIEYSAGVLYPVFFWAITVIAFFLLVRKMFINSMGKNKSSIIAVISCFFISVIPVLLPRTIAGIPEKESAGFFFLFMSLYFFLCAWKAKTPVYKYIHASLAGIFTTFMFFVWGGSIYIYLTIGIGIFISFLLNQMNKDKIVVSSIWLILSFILIVIFTDRMSPIDFFASTTTLIPLVVIFASIVNLVISNGFIKPYFESRYLKNIPQPIISLLIVAALGLIIGSLTLGMNFLPDKIKDITSPLITPVTDRLGVTVAENRQPFFSEWESNFGPHVKDIALFFWLFFFGSIYLLYFMISSFTKKEKIVSTIAYSFFLFAIIFSRYKPNSSLNGTSTSSILFYALGVIVLIGTLGKYYYQYYQKGENEKLKNVEFGIILLFSFFFLGIISARGSVRTIMVLAVPASAIVSFFIISVLDRARKTRDLTFKIFVWIIAAGIIISSAYSGYYFYKVSEATAKSYIPTIYTYQWQNAMSWVRTSTPQDAVFAHWWDYGYWIQSIGERATVTDGGNAIPYWNYLIGRHALTGKSNEESLEFLYSHNVTHFLIDSSDIGKYTAFSSIGSDEKYDRYSWLSIFTKDNKQTQETKNSTLEIYTGGTSVDGDIVYSNNGTQIYLPGGKAGVAAVIIEKDSSGEISSQPHAVYVYQNNQYRLPLRYVFDKKLIDFGSGIEAGLFIFPQLSQSGSSVTADYSGALIYLSNKTVKSQLARLYLYGEDNPYFHLVHIEDDLVVQQMNVQTVAHNGSALGNFILYNGEFRGPIKIWGLNYPQNMKVNPEYVQKTFPDAIKSRA